MSSEQQALLMVGDAGVGPPPVPLCKGDPYYTCGPDGDPYWAEVLRLYHFEDANGSTSAVDSKGIGNLSRLVGSGTVATSDFVFGAGCLIPGGSSAQWQTSLGAEATGVTEWTVEGFFKRVAASPSQGFGFFYFESNVYVVGGNPSFGRIQFVESIPRLQSPTDAFEIAAGWVHVAVSVEDAGGNNRTMRLFVNGTLQGSYAASNGTALNLASGEVLNLGRNSGAGFANADYKVDEVRLTAACRYKASFTIPAEAFPEYAQGPRTVLSIHADGVAIEDDSCYQTKAVALSGTLFDTAIITDAESKFGGKSVYVENDGTSTIRGIAVTDHQDFDFGTGDFTIDLWAYRIANTYVGTLFYGTLGGGEFSVKVGTDGLIDLIYCSSGGSQSFTNVATWPVGQWVYFVSQRRGTNWETYLGGALIHSAAITGGAGSTVNSGGDLYFGRTNVSSAQSWNGYLDDIRVTKGSARVALGNGSVLPQYVIAWISAEEALSFTNEWLRTGATGSTIGGSLSTLVFKCGAASFRAAVTTSDFAYWQLLSSTKSIQPRTGDFCFEAWLYPTEIDQAYLLSHFNTGYSGVAGLTVSLDATLRLRAGHIGVANLITSVSSISLNVWTHVAAFRRSGVWALAINGVIEATLTNSADLNATGRVEFLGIDFAPRATYAFVGYADEVRYCVGASPYSPLENFVPPVCLSSGNNFTPPALTFCESTVDGFINGVDGAEALRGVSATSSVGTLQVADAHAALTSVAAITTTGSLFPTTSSQYPNLKGNVFYNLGVTQATLIITVWLRLETDGTIWYDIFEASSLVTPIATVQLGFWIDTTDPNWVILPWSQYTFSATKTSSGGSFAVSYLDGFPNHASFYPTWPILVRTGLTFGESPLTYAYEITVLPKPSNPRYGESGYFTKITISHTLREA